MSGPVYVHTFFEERVQSLFNLAELVERAFQAGGLDYRVVGGLAAYLYVEDKEPDAGRLTKDIDIAVQRAGSRRLWRPSDCNTTARRVSCKFKNRIGVPCVWFSQTS